MPNAKPGLSRAQRIVLVLLFALPLLLVLAKQSWSPWSGPAVRHLSLLNLPAEVRHGMGHVLFWPLGVVVVAFCRLTLGIRVLGPFRSVLIAVGLQAIGIELGLLFLALVIGLVVALRPFLRAMQVPYYGRVSATFSAVAAVIVLTILASFWLDLTPLYRVTHFPMIALCLVADGFANTLEKEGYASALWRATMTALAALVLALLADIPGFHHWLLKFPELLAIHLGTVFVIARFLDFRILERVNPKPAAAPQGPAGQDSAEAQGQLLLLWKNANENASPQRDGIRETISHVGG